MKDSSIQPAADGSGPAPSTELTERLLQRATAPLGVIDVRQPQQHYARTAGWIARRFALLDRWKTRYGSDEEASGVGASLVFAVPGQTLTEPSPAVPSVVQLSRTVKQSVAAQTSTVSPTSSSPPQQFRVRRHAMPSVSPPQATVTPSSPEATIRSKAERSDSHTGEIPAIMRQAAQTPPALILSKSPGGRVEDRSEVETSGNLASNIERSHHREGRSLPVAISTPPPSENLARGTISSHYRGQTPSGAAALAQTPVSVGRVVEANPSSFPLRLQRKHSEAPTGLAKGRELSEPSVSMATTQTTLSKSSLSPLHEPPLLPGGDDSARDVTSPVAERTVFTGSGASLAKVESSASFPLVQRQAVGSERTAETVHGDVAERQAAATEIRSVPSGAPRPMMIWRQNVEGSSAGASADATIGGAGSALPLAISAARGGEPPTNTESTPPVVTTPMSAAPPASEMDVAHLAEHVSRLIARQLAVERERRGRNGWR